MEWITDFSRDSIMRSIEGTLERLKTDHVEILHLHDPDLSVSAAADSASWSIARNSKRPMS